MEKYQMLLINQFGQHLIPIQRLIEEFEKLSSSDKRVFLTYIKYLILQSKVEDSDVNTAIISSNLKPTYTPCVLLTKGVKNHNLDKIIALPELEINKVLVLFLHLFGIGYQRRFKQEKNNPHKWWYWDLSEESNVMKILFDESVK